MAKKFSQGGINPLKTASEVVNRTDHATASTAMTPALAFSPADMVISTRTLPMSSIDT
jgi:hypothetical protein